MVTSSTNEKPPPPVILFERPLTDWFHLSCSTDALWTIIHIILLHIIMLNLRKKKQAVNLSFLIDMQLKIFSRHFFLSFPVVASSHP